MLPTVEWSAAAIRKENAVAKKHRHRRPTGLQLFEGNVWTMPSIQTASEVYHAMLKQFLEKNPAEWSLVSGFFQNQPVLAFLWDPARNADMAEAVAQAATGAGGQELEAEAKETLLTQLLTRRVGLQAKEPFDTLTAHHPKGKPVWDLND
jgi:hypothetical protein